MSALRWCLPVVAGRGAGLGNELVPWARAWLMAREIGARCLPPAFGLNERRYHRHFGTSRLDWLRQRLMLRALPCVHFTEHDYRAHGGGDVSRAFAAFAAQRGLHARAPLVVATDGMWGGLPHIARARQFVRGLLWRSRHAGANLAELGARLDPGKLTVAMHVRLGDFASADSVADPAAMRGRFNVSMPLAWFVELGRQLRDAFGERVQFQVFSDGSPERLRPLLEAVQPVPTACARPADVSDLLAMAQADLLLCSVSTYSVWAAALSDAPYVWYRPQLQVHAQGLGSIWGHEPAQAAPDGATARALAEQLAHAPAQRIGRAFALDRGEALPEALRAALEQRGRQCRAAADLVHYGVA